MNARKIFKEPPSWLNKAFEGSVEKVFDGADVWLQDKVEQFLQVDPESGMSFVDALGAKLGTGFRMSLLAQKSADARHMKMVEGRVFDALKENSPEIQVGLQVLEKLGLDDLATPENLPALMQVAQKYGLFGQLGAQPLQSTGMLGNNGQLRSA